MVLGAWASHQFSITTEISICSIPVDPLKNAVAKMEVDKFFEPSEIEYEQDLRIQEAFIQAINMLIDKGIIVKPKK